MALTGALADILAQKDKNLASVPDAFVDRMVLAQREMLAEVTALLGAFDRNGSLITVTKSNLIKAEEITDLLSQLFKGGEYFKAVETLADQFDQQALLSDEYFKIIDPDYTVPTIANEVFLTRKASALELLLGDGVSANVSIPIRRELMNAVTTGASYSDTLKSLRNLIEGTPDRDGVLSRYSRLIVSDTFAMTDRSYTQTIADDVGYDWFLYAGGLMKTTRQFCRDRNARYYHRNEVAEWPQTAGEWNGKMYGTNESTIFVTAGGYNCQHSIMPVSVFAVPKADINRNIANGNFKPSAVESRLINE
tara:strand:+ start:4217 stop:5137 length:921 start_codon:yes stop_codon:yes gene_type:complete